MARLVHMDVTRTTGEATRSAKVKCATFSVKEQRHESPREFILMNVIIQYESGILPENVFA
jgi:hypothetical protein